VKENTIKPSVIRSKKKRGSLASCNSLSKLYDNSIVEGRTIGSVQQEFHCSCCARNETLAVSGSFYEIKIHKSDSEIINEYLFSPKIVKFMDSTSICCYLNFPNNWVNWQLPKRLHIKDLKIISFDKTKIIVGW
jgi:hypothetical protein